MKFDNCKKCLGEDGHDSSISCSKDRFSDLARKKLYDAGFRVEKHPNNPEFAIKKGGYCISINEDNSFSAGYDDGETTEPQVKNCRSIYEALDYFSQF
jgi:hypothetical protein